MGIGNLAALQDGCPTCFGLKKVRKTERDPWQPCPDCTEEKK